MKTHALLATVADQPGMLFQLSKVFAEQGINITHVDLLTTGGFSEIYFELTIPDADRARVMAQLGQAAGVHKVEEIPTVTRIYGKRVIVMGGGAQVGMVAMGA